MSGTQHFGVGVEYTPHFLSPPNPIFCLHYVAVTDLLQLSVDFLVESVSQAQCFVSRFCRNANTAFCSGENTVIFNITYMSTGTLQQHGYIAQWLRASVQPRPSR